MDARHARAPVRVLVVLLAAVLAATGGVVAARVAPAAPVDATEARAEVTTDDRPAPLDSRAAIARTATAIVAALSAELPVPEPPPANARAATPELRHGMLEIPAIGLAQPLFEGVTLTAIDRGPSHWPGTAMPGELGNVVVAGHRTTRTRPFWDLDLLQPGDELVFTMTSGERWVYELDRVEVVDDQDIHIIDQGYGYTATLFGCHPKGSARQRIVGHFTLQR